MRLIPDDRLLSHRRVWQRKKILKRIYGEWYERMMSEAIQGRILEIGSGTASIRDFYPEVITSDVSFSPWLDAVFDAVSLPMKDASLDSILALDVLHHLKERNVPAFFDEVTRVLKPGGRCVMLEPYISPFSYLIYNYLHPEPVDLAATIIRGTQSDTLWNDIHPNDPWDSNQAIARILFWREEGIFRKRFPALSVVKKELLSFLVYPLSGGYEHRSLIPNFSFGFFSAIEGAMSFAKKLLAFRTLIVIERNAR